jgi:hypothetical protein
MLSLSKYDTVPPFDKLRVTRLRNDLSTINPVDSTR